MAEAGGAGSGELFVTMGKWAVAPAPTLIRTLLGSCVGVVLYDRLAKMGGVAHLVLPDSRGDTSMFQTSTPGMNIGKQNHEAVERILGSLGIPILARELGGEAGRRLTLDTSSGTVSIRIPGGTDHEI